MTTQLGWHWSIRDKDGQVVMQGSAPSPDQAADDKQRAQEQLDRQ